LLNVKLDTDDGKKAFAKKLTADLDTKNPPVQTKGKKKREPHKDALLMFGWEMKRVLGQQKITQDEIRDLWSELYKTEQKIWATACKLSKELYKKSGNDKYFFSG
jgi:hypothetical protein